MKNEKIEETAKRAREVIAQIPFSQQENIGFSTCIYSDPIVSYEARKDGYYQIVNERGKIFETRIAVSSNEMVDYFVQQAIWNFALGYELRNRCKFESNMRQIHEIMERCYQYINPERKFVHESYDDTIHIYLDLFDEYKKIVKEYKQRYSEKCIGKILDDIDYLILKQYHDTPGGGMQDVPKAMNQVRERVLRLIQYDPILKETFEPYEKYYQLLPAYELF